MLTRSYSAISLYCGAGGLDLGFERAGFDIRWAIDSDPWAVQTYNANLASTAVCGDVLEIDPPQDVRPDVVIGGPPCQGFSVIGRMDPCDPRSRHVEHFLDVVAATEPRAFVMENVKALAISSRWAPIRERLVTRTAALGYQWMMAILDAQRYDAPQARERMFLIGLRDDTPMLPVPSPRRPPTVRETLSELPPFGSAGNHGICAARVVPARVPVMRPTPYRGSLMFNGSGRPLQLDGVAMTLPASMGGNATPIIDQQELANDAEPWVAAYHRRLQSGKRPLKRAPRRMRRITVQEAAALQTFPTSWSFLGPAVAQYRQIGNAVPPTLAHAVAMSIRNALERAAPPAAETDMLLAVA